MIAIPEYNGHRLEAKLKRLKTRRKRWLKVHLYLGLFAGALLVIVGLTGGILVFYQELQEVVNPELSVLQVAADAEVRDLDAIVAAAERVKPPGSRFFKVYYPRKADIAYKLLYFVRDPQQANNGDGYYIFVDPYRTQVTGMQLWHPKDRYWGRPLVSFIMQLHWCLLMGKVGGTCVAVLAALSIISLLTGLIVWWPLTGKFKQALSFKQHAGSVRFNFDLHKIVGFFSALILLPILFSGIYMNKPVQVNAVVELFSPLSRNNAYDGIDHDVYRSSEFPGRQAIGFSAAVASAEKIRPSGRIAMLNGPMDANGVYIIQKRDVSENSRFVGHQTVVVDQYSGEVLNVYNTGMGSNGDVFLDWQWSLHSGHAFGWFGRALVVLAGLACPVLFATGLIRWLQKRKAGTRALHSSYTKTLRPLIK